MGANPNLTTALDKSFQRAYEILSPLLKLQTEINVTRTQLERLQRFSYVFRLQKTIKELISEGDYTKVAREIKKQRWLVRKQDYRIIGSLLVEVHSTKWQLCRKLTLHLLTNMFHDFEEAQVIMRQMEELEPVCYFSVVLFILRFCYPCPISPPSLHTRFSRSCADGKP
jgi:hypothetical protein